VNFAQDKMFLGYPISHDEAHLSWLVITKLIKIFIKYNKNPIS